MVLQWERLSYLVIVYDVTEKIIIIVSAGRETPEWPLAWRAVNVRGSVGKIW